MNSWTTCTQQANTLTDTVSGLTLYVSPHTAPCGTRLWHSCTPSCLDVNDVVLCQLWAHKIVLDGKRRQGNETAGSGVEGVRGEERVWEKRVWERRRGCERVRRGYGKGGDRGCKRGRRGYGREEGVGGEGEGQKGCGDSREEARGTLLAHCAWSSTVACPHQSSSAECSITCRSTPLCSRTTSCSRCMMAVSWSGEAGEGEGGERGGREGRREGTKTG